MYDKDISILFKKIMFNSKYLYINYFIKIWVDNVTMLLDTLISIIF